MTRLFDNSYFIVALLEKALRPLGRSGFKEGAEKQLDLFFILDYRFLQALKHHFCQRALQKLVEFISRVGA